MTTREGYRWYRGARQPSEAQRRVLDELVAGRTNAEIGARLGLSAGTVKWHVAQLLDETGCGDRAELARWWRQAGGCGETAGMRRVSSALALKLAGCAAALAMAVAAFVAVRGGAGVGPDVSGVREALRRLIPVQTPPDVAPLPPTPTPAAPQNARRVMATVPVGGEPFAYLGTGGGSVWVPNGRDGTVSRIDARTNAVVATIDVGGDAAAFDPERRADPAAVAVSGDEVWVSVAAWRALMRIDPGTNAVAEIVDIGVHPFVVALSDDSFWVGTWDPWPPDSWGNVLLRIDRRTREVVARFPVSRPTGIAVRPDAVWVATQQSGVVLRIDPRTNAVAATITLTGIPYGVALAGGSVWVGNSRDEEVLRIDPRTNTILESVPAPGGARGVVAGEGALWALARRADTVLRIDPEP